MPLACEGATCDRHSYHESRLLYSQLHLAIIEAFLLAGKDKEDPQDEMELEPGEVMDESDSRHLIKGTDLKELTLDMSKLIDKSKTAEFNHSIIDQQVQLSMDRFAQTLQVAIATGCLSSSKGNLCVAIDNEYNWRDFRLVFYLAVVRLKGFCMMYLPPFVKPSHRICGM